MPVKIKYLIKFLDDFRAYKDIDNPARILTIVPWFHAYGLMSTINYLLVNTFIVYFSGFHPEKYLNAIQEHKVTRFYWTVFCLNKETD